MLKNIRAGIVEEGMPSWEAQLTKGELHALTVYVWSLRGKELPGREGQGQLLEEGQRSK